MTLLRVLPVLSVFALTTCAMQPVLRLPARLNSVPGKDPTLGQWLQTARDKLQQRDGKTALQSGIRDICHLGCDAVSGLAQSGPFSGCWRLLLATVLHGSLVDRRLLIYH